MFSTKEKIKIAGEIEKLLLDLRHPEMPDEKPYFKLHVDGKASWSWADIEPNWVFGEGEPAGTNLFNEISRDLHGTQHDTLKAKADLHDELVEALGLLLDDTSDMIDKVQNGKGIDSWYFTSHGKADALLAKAKAVK